MATEEFEKSKGNYLALMQIIDEYKNNEAPPSKGLLFFLEGVVSELAITKYGKSPKMEDLKEFFCNKVLQLNHGERNFCEYENYFKKGDADGYSFSSEFMNRCMEDKVLEEKGYPKLLLKQLWEVAHICLKDYFYYSSVFKKDTKPEKRNNMEQRKKDSYCRFVKSVGLYEIFVTKFLGNTSFEKVSQDWEKYEAVLDNFMEMHQKWYDAKGNLSEEETERLIQELDATIDKTYKFWDVIKETERAVEYCRHVSYLTAFSVIIMLIEFHNVNTYASIGKVKRTSLGVGIDSALEKEKRYLYMNKVKMNKGGVYSALYKAFMEVAEQNRIVKDLCGSSERAQKRALKQIKEYFDTVQFGCYQDENGDVQEDFAKVVMQIALRCTEK